MKAALADVMACSHVTAVELVQGYLAHKKLSTFLGPPEYPGHRPTVGSLGEVFFKGEVPLWTALERIRGLS